MRILTLLLAALAMFVALPAQAERVRDLGTFDWTENRPINAGKQS